MDSSVVNKMQALIDSLIAFRRVGSLRLAAGEQL